MTIHYLLCFVLVNAWQMYTRTFHVYFNLCIVHRILVDVSFMRLQKTRRCAQLVWKFYTFPVHFFPHRKSSRGRQWWVRNIWSRSGNTNDSCIYLIFPESITKTFREWQFSKTVDSLEYSRIEWTILNVCVLIKIRNCIKLRFLWQNHDLFTKCILWRVLSKNIYDIIW